MASPTMKFVDLARKSLRTIGAIGQGVPMSSNDVQVAFEACQDMFDAFAAERLTVFQTLRKVFPLVANKGSAANPYSIGIGGDFDVKRPTWIDDANLNVLTTTPYFEYPLAILTPDEWARTAIKNMASSMATCLYFDGRFDTSGADAGLGDLYLYPVPNGQMSLELVLYLPYPFDGFADQATTVYTFPAGYAEAIRYQLAKRLASEFQKQLSPETQSLITSTFAVIQRDNVVVPNLLSDFGIPGTGAQNGIWNWRTGTNSRRGGW